MLSKLLKWLRKPVDIDICVCGHHKNFHRFIGKLQSCEYGLDSYKDECCSCWRYKQNVNN